MNNNFFSKYGLNHCNLKSLFIKYGLSYKKISFISNNKNNLSENIDKFLDLYLDKKEFFLKKKYLIIMKQLDNGSISGYKKIRGLPSHSQRTRTNAKTNRKKK